MSDSWNSISVTVPTEAVPAVELAFDLAGAGGTATSFRREGSADREISITGYFETPPEMSDFEACLEEAFGIHGFDGSHVRSVTHTEVENEDWLAEWKKGWRPTTSGRFLVAPPWAELTGPVGIVILIDPSMAFGTGTHETTRLCLEMLGEAHEPGWSFLDVGTGTGVLAIAAAKVGADGVLGFDNDPDAVRIARENAELNRVGGISFTEGEFKFDGRQFDIVCANLTLDVIRPILPDLIKAARRTLILSGILFEQDASIRDALGELGIISYEVRRMNDWIAVKVDLQGLGD